MGGASTVYRRDKRSLSLKDEKNPLQAGDGVGEFIYQVIQWSYLTCFS